MPVMQTGLHLVHVCVRLQDHAARRNIIIIIEPSSNIETGPGSCSLPPPSDQALVPDCPRTQGTMPVIR